MKFRMFTDWYTGNKIAVNVEIVTGIEALDGEKPGTLIALAERVVDPAVRKWSSVRVEEDFDTVLARLNTIAE